VKRFIIMTSEDSYYDDADTMHEAEIKAKDYIDEVGGSWGYEPGFWVNIVEVKKKSLGSEKKPTCCEECDELKVDCECEDGFKNDFEHYIDFTMEDVKNET